MLLFVLGLATGLFEGKLKNPRMGLAAHLEGLMNGTFLLALGAAWQDVRLSRRMARAAFGTALYGAYANWASTTFAAVFGTAAMTPLAAGAFRGQPWQELLVAFGLVSVALAMLVSSALLLWSFRKGATVGAGAGDDAATREGA
jgi:hydroxylaminobenzene mutase